MYDAEPASTFVRLIAGLAFFNLALGVARGFHSGESIVLPMPFQALHQGAALLLSLGLVWWALGKRRGTRFSTLWNISVAIIIVGILLLSFHEETLTSAGATLISISNTFAVGLLWFSCYDVARHSGIPAYVVLGIGWLAHMLPREIGRTAIWILEPQTTEATIVIAIMVALMALAMALLLNDSIPVIRPLFAEFRVNCEKDYLRNRIIERFAESEELAPDPLTTGREAAAGPAEPEEQADVFIPLQKRYFLTERETEVARLLAQGRSRISIGEKLYISENTVRTYVKNIYAKLDIHSKQELLDLLERMQEGSIR